ncbi:hypothetical protein FRC11_013270, partial [Ceratobasidium sp. 423]
MPKVLQKVSVEFMELFALCTHQAGATNGPCTSPDGMHLLVSTPGSLTLIDTHIGGTQAFIDTGSAIDITVLVWISNAQALAGCSNGTVYTVDFHAANLFGYSPVSISHAFKDIEEPVLVLHYSWDQQEGKIFLMDTENRLLGSFFAEQNLAVTGVQCYTDCLYISLAGPFGSVIIKCYSNNPNAARELE